MGTEMMTIVKQTREERIAMFTKLTKAELIEMLINNQDCVAALTQQVAAQPSGCVCPPGAEQGCGSQFCPRRASSFDSLPTVCGTAIRGWRI